MLIDKLQATIKPTAQERAIIDFIVQNPTFIETCTVRELAQASLTSPPTVIRLCQKLGFNGFSDFRLQFVSEQRASRRNLYADLSHALVSEDSSAEDIHRVLPKFYSSIVYETNEHLSNEKLAQLKNLIQSVRVLDIYGTGVNYHVAAQAAFHLQTVGTTCCVFDEANVHMIECLTPADKHVSILLSHTGTNCKILEIARILTNRGLPTIAITKHAESPLGQLADVTIELFQTPELNRLSLLSYTVSLTYIFDLLYTVLLADKLDQTFQESSADFYVPAED